MNKFLFYLSIQNMASQTTKLGTCDILDIINEIITNTKKENRIKEKAKDILPLVNSFVSFTYRE